MKLNLKAAWQAVQSLGTDVLHAFLSPAGQERKAIEKVKGPIALVNEKGHFSYRSGGSSIFTDYGYRGVDTPGLDMTTHLNEWRNDKSAWEARYNAPAKIDPAFGGPSLANG